MKRLAICLIIFIFFIVLLSGFSSARKTLIAGKTYNEDYSETIPGVKVIIECNALLYSSQEIPVYRETISLEDGTYAVFFQNQSEGCAFGSVVRVTATKDSLYGYKIGIVDQQLEELDILILNVPLSPIN